MDHQGDLTGELGALDARRARGGRGPRCARASPIDGGELARLRAHSRQAVAATAAARTRPSCAGATCPRPRRGELVRLFGEELRGPRSALGAWSPSRRARSSQEGLGEVQEMIDICDFAVGLSRQLHGLTIASERPGHRMMETWHPLGVDGRDQRVQLPRGRVGVERGAGAGLRRPRGVEAVGEDAAYRARLPARSSSARAEGSRTAGRRPEGLAAVVLGAREQRRAGWSTTRASRSSRATGCTRMGRAVAPRTAARFGRTILELGGNNAMIVAPSADLDLAVRAITFSAVGTAGQRCTSLRRLIVHESVRDGARRAARKAYASAHDRQSAGRGHARRPAHRHGGRSSAMQAALARAHGRRRRGRAGGERVLAARFPERPTCARRS